MILKLWNNLAYKVLFDTLLLCLLSLHLVLRWNCMTGLLINSVWCRNLGSSNKYTCINLSDYTHAGSLRMNSHTLPCYLAGLSCIVFNPDGGHHQLCHVCVHMCMQKHAHVLWHGSLSMAVLVWRALPGHGFCHQESVFSRSTNMNDVPTEGPLYYKIYLCL